MHEYKFRPGYGSDSFLIEFFINNESESVFFSDFNEIIKDLNPIRIPTTTFCDFNEKVYDYDSDSGKFSISIDNWGFIFIMSEENQETIFKIENLINQSKLFVKMDSKNLDYQINSNQKYSFIRDFWKRIWN